MTYLPSIEAIEEFKVQSAVYSAEYGVNSGAQINVAIKSGTNNLHGTLFEFVRNDKFDARGFFLPPTSRRTSCAGTSMAALAPAASRRTARSGW